MADVGQPLGAAAPRRRGGWVCAVRDGFLLLDADGVLEQRLAWDAEEPRRRMNDGRCDPSGRFWAGTMDTEFQRADGRLVRLEAGTVTVMSKGLRVSNGLGWSPDGRTMYLIDTLAAALWCFAFDASTGALGPRRLLREIPNAWGKADGLCVGADGDLWIACYDGAAVRRLSPDGALRDKVELPVSRPTCPCLAPDGTLYVTSERVDAQSASGSILAVAVGAPGLPTARFAG